MGRYRPPETRPHDLFTAVPTFMRLPLVREAVPGLDLAVVGIPFDGLASYRAGARFGPKAIREASARSRPYDPVLDVDIFETCTAADYGDVEVVTGYTDLTFANFQTAFTPLFAAGIVPLALGGDHSISLPVLRGLADAGRGPVALVHFDAHLDTYRRPDPEADSRYGHSNPFRKAAEEGLLLPDKSIQIGIRGNYRRKDGLADSLELGFEVVTAWEVRRLGIPAVLERIHQRVGTAPVFLSFDVDFVDPAFAPATGTPEVAGFTSHESLEFLAGLKGLRLIGCDLVELLPELDHAEVTALLAAQLIARLMALVACQRA